MCVRKFKCCVNAPNWLSYISLAVLQNPAVKFTLAKTLVNYQNT